MRTTRQPTRHVAAGSRSNERVGDVVGAAVTGGARVLSVFDPEPHALSGGRMDVWA
jgi:hypothetical protein